ncbi:hypothetical protein M405DRAFT_864486 [Rhizopogon salebrosus TDB-379]|nr:hypothetical protein M405DRAFT_864486 [Rhizopogon salebrosus TDB-379]
MSVLGLSSVFDGFAWVEGMREWRVEGTLEAKLGRWHEEGLSGDVGLMILWLFDGEDEDADGLSEESEEDKEIPAISCFRVMRLFPEHVFWHPPTPATKQVFPPETHPHYDLTLIIFPQLPVYDESNRSIAHPAPGTPYYTGGTSRESVLPIRSSSAQLRRSQPDALALPFARSTLNPYLSVMLTFLATIAKHAEALLALERSIPWHDLTQFFAAIALGTNERWTWIVQPVLCLSSVFDGFTWVEGTR